ncbi:MAG: hypothetical protein IPO92_17150 [Saprospiraceae bacterium]|nr:hypothetical protein [Saprospiraceae bacterium]
MTARNKDIPLLDYAKDRDKAASLRHIVTRIEFQVLTHDFEGGLPPFIK